MTKHRTLTNSALDENPGNSAYHEVNTAEEIRINNTQGNKTPLRKYTFDRADDVNLIQI